MFRKVVALFVLAAVANAAVIPESNPAYLTPGDRAGEYTLIGKYSPVVEPAAVESTGANQTINNATSFYFLSQNAAGWSTAATDCRNNLGDTASLVYIETDAELQVVSAFIHNSDDTGSTYWTGGRFDVDSGKFVWDNGVEIIAAVPWDQGHPTTQTALSKVSAFTAGGLSLRTDFQTVSLRYICELTV